MKKLLPYLTPISHGIIPTSSENRNSVNDEVLQILRSGEIRGLEHYHIIKGDPDDDKFTDCAVGGNGNFIVTNDKHLLDLEDFKEIYIVNLPTIKEIMDW